MVPAAIVILVIFGVLVAGWTQDRFAQKQRMEAMEEKMADHQRDFDKLLGRLEQAEGRLDDMDEDRELLARLEELESRFK